jgi:undecaprenyl-diphosphatase
MRHDERDELSVRLVQAAAGAVVLLVPFGVIAAAVARGVGPLRGLDGKVTDALNRYALAHPGSVTFAKVWSIVFVPDTWRVAALVLAVWLVRRGARPLAWWVVATMAAGGLLGWVLKLLFGRRRPHLIDSVAHAAGYSFPSGHALNNALGAAVFVLVLLPLVRNRPVARAALWVSAVAIPLITGVCRVLLGLHWTSDVVGGWLLGLAVPAMTAWAYLQLRNRRHPHVMEEGLAPEIAVPAPEIAVPAPEIAVPAPEIAEPPTKAEPAPRNPRP